MKKNASAALEMLKNQHHWMIFFPGVSTVTNVTVWFHHDGPP